MRTLVFDTGALVALQRERQLLRALVRTAHRRGYRLRTSAPVLTEFLGGSPKGLRDAAAYVSSHLMIGSVDEERARRAAHLLQMALDAGGPARPSSIDSLVAAEAESAPGMIVYDGDRADYEALAGASRGFELVELSELSR